MISSISRLPWHFISSKWQGKLPAVDGANLHRGDGRGEGGEGRLPQLPRGEQEAKGLSKQVQKTRSNSKEI